MSNLWEWILANTFLKARNRRDTANKEQKLGNPLKSWKSTKEISSHEVGMLFSISNPPPFISTVKNKKKKKKRWNKEERSQISNLKPQTSSTRDETVSPTTYWLQPVKSGGGWNCESKKSGIDQASGCVVRIKSDSFRCSSVASGVYPRIWHGIRFFCERVWNISGFVLNACSFRRIKVLHA